MIVGSGLLARTFSRRYGSCENVCIYAAGVSNSSCVESNEFNREKNRLIITIEKRPADQMLVYFSTCSIYDAEKVDTPYVQHKLAMEELVRQTRNYLIFRLPQAVGTSANPHTLLNSFYNKIQRGESVTVWVGAERNLVDVEDIERIAAAVIGRGNRQNRILNIANPQNYRISEIISMFRRVLGREVLFVEQERGSGYPIDISEIAGVIQDLKMDFDNSYLEKIVRKYYGSY